MHPGRVHWSVSLQIGRSPPSSVKIKKKERITSFINNPFESNENQFKIKKRKTKRKVELNALHISSPVSVPPSF